MTMSKLRDVFVRCQDGIQHHNKLCKKLDKIFQKTHPTSFWDDFLYHVKHCFEFSTREPAVERMIDFVVKFVTTVAKAEPGEDDKKDDEDRIKNVDDDTPAGGGWLLNNLINFLLQHHNYEDSVRFRCCQLINKLLSSLSDDAEIDEDLYDRIYKAMLDRLRDVLPVVRIQAVGALTRLQDPSDDNCPVIKAFLVMMYDPNADVRKAVVATISPSLKTLPEILKRTRDVSDAVRRQAFAVVADKVHIRSLTIGDRVRLLQDGLNDRVESVRDTCLSKLLQAWLLTYGGNALDLLQSLDVEMSVDVCRQALVNLFKVSPVTELVNNFDLLDDNCLIPLDHLTAANAFYWFNLCDYIHSSMPATSDQFDKLIPDCMQFCDYLTRYTEVIRQTHSASDSRDEDNLILEMGQTFICEQLVRITSLFELSDLAISNRMKALYHHLLLQDCIPDSLVEHIIARLIPLRKETSSLVVYLAETIADIREPITVVEKSIDEADKRQVNLKIASIRVEINQVREDLETAVQGQDYIQAGTLKEKLDKLEQERDGLVSSLQPQTQEVRTEKSDPATLMKCLSIIKQLLVNVDISAIDPTLRTISESLILPCILRSEVKVRDLAISCLGILCLISKEFALQYLVLLIQVTQVDHDRVRVTGLKTLFDLLHVYGMTILESSDASDDVSADRSEDDVDKDKEKVSREDAEKTTENLVAILVSMLDSENSEIRTVTAEGLAKLLLAGRLSSAKLFSRLVLLWYNPVSEEDGRLRHCLAEFFPLFAMCGRDNQQVIQEAFAMTLKTLMDAPSSSPLFAVDVDHVSNLFVGLTSARLLAEKKQLHACDFVDHTIHNELAITLCNDILSNPDSFNVRVLTNALKSLDLNPENAFHMRDIATLTSQIIQVVKDKKALKLLEKFHSHVTLLSKRVNPTENSTDNADEAVSQLAKDSNVSDVTNGECEVTADEAISDSEKGEEDVFDPNPAELYRTMIEDANKSRSMTRSENSMSSESSDKVEKHQEVDADMSQLQSQLSGSLRISVPEAGDPLHT